ncbi:MAG: TlpA disulfide reductase family protein [Acidobacteriaceae bacterium]
MLCLLASSAAPAVASTSLLSKPAPEFTRADLNHKRLDLRAYRGKVVLLNFWATWCAPCQLEMPTFVAWQNEYGAQGLQVIGISMDDDAAPVRSLYKKLHLDYPVALGDAKLGELYGGVLGLPVTFLIDRDGKIRAEFQGETNLGKIQSAFQPLLKAH